MSRDRRRDRGRVRQQRRDRVHKATDRPTAVAGSRNASRGRGDVRMTTDEIMALTRGG